MKETNPKRQSVAEIINNHRKLAQDIKDRSGLFQEQPHYIEAMSKHDDFLVSIHNETSEDSNLQLVKRPFFFDEPKGRTEKPQSLQKGHLLLSKIALGIGGFSLAVALFAGSVLTWRMNDIEDANAKDMALIKDDILSVTKKVDELTANTKSAVTLENLSDVLLENPDAIFKSIAKYQFEQQQKEKEAQKEKQTSYASDLFEGNDPVLGNPNGKHVLVEFADYNCGYCKRISSVLKEFVEKDPEAKVIIKDYPILGQQSQLLALNAMALFIENPDAYPYFHDFMMSESGLTNEKAEKWLERFGVNLDSLKGHYPEARDKLDQVRSLGAQLEVTGTPTIFFADGERTNGGFTADQLIAAFKKQDQD